MLRALPLTLYRAQAHWAQSRLHFFCYSCLVSSELTFQLQTLSALFCRVSITRVQPTGSPRGHVLSLCPPAPFRPHSCGHTKCHMDASDTEPACLAQTTFRAPGSLRLSSLFHFQPTVCFLRGWVLLISRCIY